MAGVPTAKGETVSVTSGGLIKASGQWTPAQYEWLKTRAERLGLTSASAVARMVVQAAIDAERREAEAA